MANRWKTKGRSWTVLLPALLAAVLFPAPARGATLRGQVVSGATPLTTLTVALWATDPAHPLRCATALGAALTVGDGSFEIDYDAPADDDAVLYAIADGGSVSPGKLPRAGQCRKFAGPVVLAAVLGTAGPEPVPTDVVLNERTTVAAAYGLAQFIDGPRIGGKARGLQNAAGMAQNLADPTTGDVANTLATHPNGGETETLGSFNSLANTVAACVASPAACTTLFELATPPRGPAPTDTLQALVDVARHPATSTAAVEGLWDLSLEPPAPYQPVRDPAVAPAAWTLALLFEGDGMTMDGPGNIAFDEVGRIWVNDNYSFSPDGDAIVCGGKYLFQFTPTGRYVPGSPYVGGGIDGAGLGITLDPKGDVWVGNFGFASPDCTDKPAGNSVSKFAPDGTPLSPPTGYTNGGIDSPQGTVSDREGSIWIANCGNNTVTKFPGGDPTAALQFLTDPACGTQPGCGRPFDIALNRKGWAFVTLNGRNSVVVLRPDGTPLPTSPIEGVFDLPMGIAADSRGNMWVSNSATIRPPCPDGGGDLLSTDGSVTMIRRDGRATKGPFIGGGLTIPWGIAVDGDDNVWVANFGGRRVSQICGRNPRACPPGAETGSPISPEPGYAFDGLTRNTGVQVDRSGNVWLANNWKNLPNPDRNPGGYQIAAFIGIAPPIATPLIGPPTRP